MAEEGTGSGTGEGTGTGTGSSGTGESWTSALPEAVRSHASLKDVKDVGDLASRYVTLNGPFAERLPEKIRGEAAFKDIKSVDALAESYLSAQRMIGVPKEQLLKLPTATADAKDWDPIYNRLGRPEKPDGYKLTVPEGAAAPEAEYVASISAKAHELGVSQKQLDGMYGWLYENATKAQAAAKADRDGKIAASVGVLKTEWGQAFDRNIQRAEAAVDYYDDALKMGGNLKAALNRDGLGNNPGLAKLFHALSANLNEDGKLTGKSFGSETLMSPGEAAQSISALYGDKDFMKDYMNPNKRDPAHIAAVSKMEALFKLKANQAA